MCAQYHPTAVFECLWPLDANQGTPKPSPNFRALNFHVNLPNQWKNSSYGIKYFRCEGFDYDVWQKNSTLMRQVIAFATSTLGRPAEECMFLSGLYGPPDPPMAQAYGMWLPLKLYSFCFWAFDQFCLNSPSGAAPDRIGAGEQCAVLQAERCPRTSRCVMARTGPAGGWRRAQSVPGEHEGVRMSNYPFGHRRAVHAVHAGRRVLDQAARNHHDSRHWRGRFDHQCRVDRPGVCGRLRRAVRSTTNSSSTRRRPDRSSPGASAARSGPRPPATRTARP